MGKKGTAVTAIAICILLIGVGTYFLFLKPAKVIAPSTETKSSSSTLSKNVIQTKNDSALGDYLTSSSGAPLYTYEKDTPGESNCMDSCLGAWPAYVPTDSSATMEENLSVITRSDSVMQYAYRGMPLYTFVSDSNGKVTGDGVNGFKLAKP
jgi:predicted lipoprotein with Yx(FWY)xxD motif